LTAATKLYLVRRWLRDEPDSVEFRAAERSLLALRDYQRAVARHGGALPPGRHRSGDALVLVSGGEWPDQVFAAGAEWPGDTWSTDLADPPVTLRYGPPPTGAAAVAWQGRLEEPLAGDWAIVLPHGDRWWMDPRFLRWAGPAGAALAGFLLIPAALLISIRRRRRLDDARARFINELAHDLRTPLTSLRLYAEMLSAGKVGEEDRGRYVDTMARESARVSGLLANLLDLSRLERGKRVFETSRIDLDEAVEAAARDFAALYPDRADDLHVRGSDDMGVRGDRTALARCLANLLDNAGKFTEPGTPIRISWDMADEGVVRLVVSDEGPGIPRAERKKLFARYVRGSAAAAGVPGTGLGLSLVRELIEGMGGSARFARAERGTAVELRLPGGVDG
ncbi:MAG: sensor histidine kinase, partial [Planctomycetota bacterium]